MKKTSRSKEKKIERWFCKKHGLEGEVGIDWCFGCYKLDEDTEKPIPHLNYETNK